MKKIFFLFCISLFSFQYSFGWGQIGHRTIGQIAEWHLKKRAFKRISQILGPETMAMTSTWMDEIRSDDAYEHTYTWHWSTIPTGETYMPEKQEASGDAYQALQNIVAGLKSDTLSEKQEAEYLKMLIHIVGDLHQPLHVGTGDDRGGNDVKVKWMGEESNLHRVWDSDMIDSKQLSYTELAAYLNRFGSKDKIDRWQSDPVSQWMKEDMDLRETVYDIPDDNYLSYGYSYVNYPVVEHRLLQAGIRLAAILNDIYG